MLKVYSLTLIVLLNLGLKAQVIPGFAIVTQSSVTCTNAPATFSAFTQAGTATFTWNVSPSQYAKISDSHSSAVTITFSKDLTYTINVTAAENGTVSTLKKIQPVYRTARASFNASLDSYGYPAEMRLTNYSSGIVKNYWIYSDQLVRDSSTNTTKLYNAGGNYTVSLLAVGQKGCNDTASYAFRISDSSSVVLPNVFTPNRDDINDIFKPILTGINDLHVYIFDRAGIMMSSWHKVNGSWDGRTTSGEVCQDGVYFVVLEATGFDGKSYKMNSTLTLIR